jgi:hypothetical protein
LRACQLTSHQSNRKINTSPTTVEDASILKKMLTTPPVKKIDLHFPLGLEVTARNLKGVTIKDAMDAIYKAYKKRVRFWSTPPPPKCHPSILLYPNVPPVVRRCGV